MTDWQHSVRPNWLAVLCLHRVVRQPGARPLRTHPHVAGARALASEAAVANALERDADFGRRFSLTFAGPFLRFAADARPLSCGDPRRP
jgi:hypothetical protein